MDALLERARLVLEEDRHAAETLIQEVLSLDPGNPQARSLYARALDHERNEMVGQMVSSARRLRADDNLEIAVAELEQGLARFPSDSRLATLYDTLNRELGQARRKKARLSDLDELRNLQ